MKDIQDNQKGLMALAKEKPSVVKKMGYDPESFAAGGIAMLQAGGITMNPIGDIGLDPDEAIEQFIRNQETEDGIESMLKKSIEDSIKEEDIDYFIEKLKKGESFDDPDDPFGVKQSMERMGSLSVPDDVMNIVPTREQGPYDSGDPFMQDALNKGQARTLLTRGGIGPLVEPNLPGIRRMNEGGDVLSTELENLRDLLVDAGLDDEEVARQIAAAKLYAGQETKPGSAVYIPTDSALKAVYRPYYSEVTKQYNLDRPIDPQTGEPIPFNPLLGPSASAVDFNLTPQRLAGVEYANAPMPARTQGIGPLAKDVGPVSAPAEMRPKPVNKSGFFGSIPRDVIEEMRGMPKMNLAMMAEGGMTMDGQYFPDLDDLITGPGGERDDKIPAMLSDGEFVTNARAVRGIGALAGAPMDDPFAQRMEGAKQMYAMQKAAEDYMKRMR